MCFMSMPSNPYIAGNPVRGQAQFIGRADVLRDGLRALLNPSTNAMVLFGQRRIGKTSVLLHIEQALQASHEFTPVYFDLQGTAALPLAEVLYQIAQKIAAVIKIALPERNQFDPHGQFFQATFIPAAVQTSQNQGLVLLLDEFDVLDTPQQDQAVNTFFPYLREWMPVVKGMQFVFVIGRRPEDLSTNTLAAFKAILSRQVSLMAHDDCIAIIRQSEKNGSLTWHDDAVERVWYWTQGHPYFTQLLCSEIWETVLSEAEENVTMSVSVENVDAALEKALEQGANALQWIWNGLPPAERIVMAAMAEAKDEQISQDELTDILNRSKVRLILRELELAPETLIKWDLLRPAEGGFRFAIPLLQHWVRREKPLRRVKAELDSVEPLAESLYRSGEGFYKLGNLNDAEQYLRRALSINPNHFLARLRLGQVLIGQGNPAAAVTELEPAYQFDPRFARSGLLAALLALAETQPEDDQLATYDRILTVDSDQAEALAKKRYILQNRIEIALKADDLATALKLYQQMGDQENVSRIQVMLRKRELETHVTEARKNEEMEDWAAAITIYEKLLKEFPAEGDWQASLEEVPRKKEATLRQRAETALNANDLETALKLYQQIGDQENVNRVQTMVLKYELEAQAKKLEKTENWAAAILRYEQLLAEFPDDAEWRVKLAEVKNQQELAELYGQARNALQKGDKKLAQKFFGKVIGIQLNYKDALRYLLQANTEETQQQTRIVVVVMLLITVGVAAIFYNRGYENGRQAVMALLTPPPAKTPTEAIVVTPTNTPPPAPTDTPTAMPTVTPTNIPTATPTSSPTATPTVEPTPTPTATPTSSPTATPTVEPTPTPTATPTSSPTVEPTPTPTATPTVSPTATPTLEPTSTPTATPTARPKATRTPQPTPTATPDKIGNMLKNMKFVKIEGGDFQMGNPRESKECVNYADCPVHTVTVDGFWMGQYEVTQAEWTAVMGENPSFFIGKNTDNYPVERVSWCQVQDFLKKLNDYAKKDVYRLPTEAEWEYAARAGAKTMFYFGDDAGKLGDYAWYVENSDEIQPVGKKSPNTWGLYDMQGNVWEWCQDWYDPKYYEKSPKDNPRGPTKESSDKTRVVRGGNFKTAPEYCRVTYRYSFAPNDSGFKYDNIGFRLVKTPRNAFGDRDPMDYCKDK